MDVYTQIVRQIIRAQQTIIGPLAIDQARKVSGISMAGTSIEDINLSGNGKVILEKLVEKFSTLFGQASIEVCKDAVKEIHPSVPSDQLPQILL